MNLSLWGGAFSFSITFYYLRFWLHTGSSLVAASEGLIFVVLQELLTGEACLVA